MYVFLKLTYENVFWKLAGKTKFMKFRAKMHINRSYPSFLNLSGFLSHLSYPEFRINEDTLTQSGFINMTFLP